MKILIVDDSTVARSAIHKELVPSGYEMLEASNGVKALAMFRFHRPDMVTLDGNMPGMDGFEICEEIQKIAAGLSDGKGQALRPRVIFITSNDTFNDRMRGMEVGASDFIVKPFARGHLLNLVHSLLNPLRPYAGKRALVADDSPLVRRITGDVLQHLGFAVWEATNGEEALEIIQNSARNAEVGQGPGNPLDLVICDFNMPKMNGDEVCRQVRANSALQGLPIVVMSAITSVETVFEALRAGASDFIPKPFVKEVFLSRLHALMATRAPVQGNSVKMELNCDAAWKKLAKTLMGDGLKDGLREIILAANYLKQAEITGSNTPPLAGKILQTASSLLDQITIQQEQMPQA